MYYVPIFADTKITYFADASAHHQPKCVALYHQQLSYCVTQFVEKDGETGQLVIKSLCRLWPWSCSTKQVRKGEAPRRIRRGWRAHPACGGGVCVCVCVCRGGLLYRLRREISELCDGVSALIPTCLHLTYARHSTPLHANKVLLMNELEEIMEFLPQNFFDTGAGPPLMDLITRCVGSVHFQVAERALFLWYVDEHLYNIQCSEIITLRYEKLHTEA